MPSLLKWQEQEVTEEVFGCRRGRNAEQMMIQIAMDLESPALQRMIMSQAWLMTFARLLT